MPSAALIKVPKMSARFLALGVGLTCRHGYVQELSGSPRAGQELPGQATGKRMSQLLRHSIVALKEIKHVSCPFLFLLMHSFHAAADAACAQACCVCLDASAGRALE